MTEKGCDNCYYTYFDEKAYPCSLCIRGIERKDMWQPSKKTKADRKTEPMADYKKWEAPPKIDLPTDLPTEITTCVSVLASALEIEDDPQTCDTCKWGEWYRKGYDITMMSDVCGGCCSWNNKWKPQTEGEV